MCATKVLSSVHYLVWQGLALCSHDEKEGNMMQLLQIWSFHDGDVRVAERGQVSDH